MMRRLMYNRAKIFDVPYAAKPSASRIVTKPIVCFIYFVTPIGF